MGGSSQQLKLQWPGAKCPRGPAPPEAVCCPHPPISGSSLAVRTPPNVCPEPSTVACEALPGSEGYFGAPGHSGDRALSSVGALEWGRGRV